MKHIFLVLVVYLVAASNFADDSGVNQVQEGAHLNFVKSTAVGSLEFPASSQLEAVENTVLSADANIQNSTSHMRSVEIAKTYETNGSVDLIAAKKVASIKEEANANASISKDTQVGSKIEVAVGASEQISEVQITQVADKDTQTLANANMRVETDVVSVDMGEDAAAREESIEPVEDLFDAGDSQTASADISNADPYESWNRKVFAFNDVLDHYTLKPIAQVYNFITPRLVDNGIKNVFSNLGEVNTFVNSLLQGRFKNGAYSMVRLLVNSTFGVVGVFDVATRLGVVVDKENFSQTLGAWGVGKGPYLMLPFVGAATPRSVVGMTSSFYLYPITYMNQLSARDPLYIVDVVNRRAALLGPEKLIMGDRYTFIRDYYLNHMDQDAHDTDERLMLKKDDDFVQ